MSDDERPKGIIFCGRDGKWREQLERRLQTDEKVTLTALGDIRYDLMRYVERRGDVKILKVETRYMKSREKGLGLKVTVQKLSTHVIS